MRIIKVGGAWRVDAFSVCPPAQEMGKIIDEVKQGTVVIQKYKKAIGRKGIKSEDIDAELGRAMVKVAEGWRHQHRTALISTDYEPLAPLTLLPVR